MMENTLDVRVSHVCAEAENIKSYELVAASGENLPPFSAGSHIDLHLPDKMIRSYSLVNDPSERQRYVIAINRDAGGRGGSRFIHDHFDVGYSLAISKPRNNFALNESAGHSVLIAGGIGITPLLCMARSLAASGRPWVLHYAARSRAAAAYLDELQKIGEGSAGRVQIDLDDERSGRVFDIASIVNASPANAHLYCCGPVPMLEAFERATAQRPRECVHVEYFHAKDAPAVGGGFSVTLARSKRTLEVLPGKTILESILDTGVLANYACSEGVCGTCETRVLEGVPDHRDQFLSEEERNSNKTIMICCSGSKSPTLVLDL
jgi:tetrachlorobenzoquinone reductase